MELNLTKPIVFFDIESTGINVATDRIVEFSYLKIFPDGRKASKTYLVNPTIPISAEATSIHGITNEDVKDAPTFNEIAKEIAREFEGCDLGGYNSNTFDIPMLAEEFLRAGVDIDFKKHRFVDVKVIFHKMEQRTLSAAYQFYCNKELDGAHSAEADTLATYEILKAQVERYQGKTCKNAKGEESDPIENDMDVLAAFSMHNKNADFAGRIVYNNKGEEVFNFGKYKNKPVVEVLEKDPGYYGWMMKGDFPLYTKKVLTNIKLRQRMG
jgi:DNA polymerase-3 subunit epsilon